MGTLLACPFCREMFATGEVKICPNCDIAVVPLAELPPSYEGEQEAPVREPVAPEDELLPFGYLGRNRGPLVLLSVVGVAVFFFAPWLQQTAPEIVTWSGYEFAKRLPWLWAAAIAWLIMLALVLSRRTIRQMRGARLAAALLAAMVVATVGLRLGIAPTAHRLVPLRYQWGWGMYLAGLVGLVGMLLGVRFGGSMIDMPTQKTRRGDETLH